MDVNARVIGDGWNRPAPFETDQIHFVSSLGERDGVVLYAQIAAQVSKDDGNGSHAPLDLAPPRHGCSGAVSAPVAPTASRALGVVDATRGRKVARDYS